MASPLLRSYGRTGLTLTHTRMLSLALASFTDKMLVEV